MYMWHGEGVTVPLLWQDATLLAGLTGPTQKAGPTFPWKSGRMRPLDSCGACSLSRYSMTLSEAPMLSMIPPAQQIDPLRVYNLFTWIPLHSVMALQSFLRPEIGCKAQSSAYGCMSPAFPSTAMLCRLHVCAPTWALLQYSGAQTAGHG